MPQHPLMSPLKVSQLLIQQYLNQLAQLKKVAGIWDEGDGYVAICPALDIANQGSAIEVAGRI